MYTQMPALLSLPPLEAITQRRAELLCYLAAPRALFFTRQCVSVSGPLPEGRKLRGASLVKNLPAVRETWVRFLGRSSGEGNGHPLQYSCLENSMDRGAWLQSMGSQRVRHD